MHESGFDYFARRAGSVQDRRASLKTLGATAAVAAAALVAPRAAEAGKADKQSTKPCRKQVNACKQAFKRACQGGEICLSLATCCNFLRTCDAAGQITCMTDIL